MKAIAKLALLFAATPVLAQPVGTPLMKVNVAPSGICQQGDAPQIVVPVGTIWTCQNIAASGQGAWAQASGSSTVNPGTTGQIAYYGTNGTAVSTGGYGITVASLPCDGTTDVTAAAQTALNAKGRVWFTSSSPTNTCVLTSSLVESSQTHLTLPSTLTMTEAANAYFPLLVNNGYNSRATSGVAVTLTWSSGNSVSVAWTNHGLSVGDYVWIRNSTASTYTSYNGVFKVATVTDANDFTVNYDLAPTASAPAGMVASKADVDESVDGGIWNYNGTTAGTCSGLQCNAIVFGGVQNVRISNMTLTQVEKYSLHVGAARDVIVDNIEDKNTYSDAIKLLGPLHNVRVTNVHGLNGDDQVTFQNDQGSGFSTYAWTEGDITGPNYVSNISLNNSGVGAIVGLIACGTEYMGGLEIDGASGITSSSNSVIMLTTACSSGAIHGIVKARNITPYGGAKALYVDPPFYGTGGAPTLTVDNIDFEGNLSNTASLAPIQIANGATVTNSSFSFTYNNASLANSTQLIQAACVTGNHCTVGNMNIHDSTVLSNYRARLLNISAFATMSGPVKITNLNDNTGANLIVVDSTTLAAPTVNIDNSNLTVASVMNCSFNCNLTLNNSTVNNASGGVLSATGTITLSGYGANNNFTGTTVYTHTNSGSPTYLTNQVFRCLTAGTVLPVGALTIDNTQCGTFSDTGVRLQ